MSKDLVNMQETRHLRENIAVERIFVLILA